MENDILEKLNELYHRAREEELFSDEAGELFSEAVSIRREYEKKAEPMVTVLRSGNLSFFSDMLSKDLAEEILIKKSRGFGMLRSGEEDNSLYPVSAVVFYVDREGVENRPILRIKWMYVHPLFRNRGIGNAMMGELFYLIKTEGIDGISVDLPASDQGSLFKEFLEKWQFTFEKGLEPDFILRLSDMENKEELSAEAGKVKALSSLEKPAAGSLIRSVFKKDGYQGFLSNVPEGYLDFDLSCYIKGEDSVSALALVHILPGGSLVTEYVYTDPLNEALTMDLTIFVALKAQERFGGDRILRMKTEDFGTAHLLDKIFPRQQTILLEEGILHRP